MKVLIYQQVGWCEVIETCNLVASIRAPGKNMEGGVRVSRGPTPQRQDVIPEQTKDALRT